MESEINTHYANLDKKIRILENCIEDIKSLGMIKLANQEALFCFCQDWRDRNLERK